MASNLEIQEVRRSTDDAIGSFLSVDVDPSSLDKGVINRLPSSLDETVAALEENEVLKETLGVSLVKVITAIRHVCFSYLLIFHSIKCLAQ